AVHNLVTPSRTIKDACQIYLAQQKDSVEGTAASKANEKIANLSMGNNLHNTIEMHQQLGFSHRGPLLEESQLVPTSLSIQKTSSIQRQPNADEKSFIMANAKYATNKKKGFLRKMAGRERSYQKFDEDGNPVDDQEDQEDQSHAFEGGYHE